MRRRRLPAMSIVKRATTWLAVMVAAVTTATVVAASPASAIDPPGSALATSAYGTAYFNGSTMVLSIKDTHADGYGVVVVDFRSDLDPTGPYRGWNRDGYDTTTYYYLHMPYLASIKFVVCGEKDGIEISSTCGVQVTGYAEPEM
jgi:hypothetical protein